MKKFYFLFSLIFSLTTMQSQTYYPFPTDSAEWDVGLTCQVAFCPPNALVCPYQTVQKGDTFLNGKSYHKLYNKMNNNLHSFYREANKKIYSKYPLGGVFSNDTAEFVLYDFNLVLGDSFVVKVPSSWVCGMCPMIIQPKIYLNSTGTISVNSNIHKTYSFTSNNFGPCKNLASPIWIEGVGSTSGFFYNLNYQPWSICLSFPAPYNIFLNCFMRNYYLYPYTLNGCTTSIQENNYSQANFKVFPNPSNGKFKVEIINKNSLPKNIFIKNILGQTILAFDNPTNELTVDNIDKGIYFINIVYSDKTSTQKLIIE